MKHWHVVYVRSRAEKKLALDLQKAGWEVYLPLNTEFRKWSDRVKKVQVPLFKSYLFVKSDARSLSDLQQFPEVVTLVRIGREYARIRDEEIEAIRTFESSGLTLEVEAMQLELGEEVEVIAGPLRGLRGALIEKSGQSRFVLRLDDLEHMIKVQLPAYQLKRL